MGLSVFIPHVDLPILFTRAARRAGISMEYTQGFSPHPRTAFGPPLPVGIVGLREPAEFWFERWNDNSLASWRAAMPAGIDIFEAKETSGISLAKLCAAASYIIEPLNGAGPEDISRTLEDEFTGLGTLLDIKTTGREITLSVTDLERSGASRMVKSLVASRMISGWKDLSIVRTAVGRWDESAGVTQGTEEYCE
jgi:radical SAM-linked protein